MEADPFSFRRNKIWQVRKMGHCSEDVILRRLRLAFIAHVLMFAMTARAVNHESRAGKKVDPGPAQGGSGAEPIYVAGVEIVGERSSTTESAADCANDLLYNGSRSELVARVDEILDGLVKDGFLTEVDRLNFVKTGEAKKIYELYNNERVSGRQLTDLIDAYGELSVGDPIGPQRPINVSAKGNIDSSWQVRSLVVTENSPLDESDKAIVLSNPKKVYRTTIGVIEYSLRGRKNETVHVVSIAISHAEREKGFSTVLFEEMLKMEPQCRRVKGELAESNLSALRKGLASTDSLRKAFEWTPAFKSLSKLGFNKITVRRRMEKGEIVYEFTAVRF